jgi:hypothetical protein
MKISTENKKRLIDEIKFVLEKMRKETDPNNKLYYFSAVFGIMNRIYNLESAPDLVFAHFVLNSTHTEITVRLHDSEKVIELPEGFFDNFVDATAELLDVIEKNKNPYEILRRFVLLGYVTTGNGYYLYQKGLIKI